MWGLESWENVLWEARNTSLLLLRVVTGEKCYSRLMNFSKRMNCHRGKKSRKRLITYVILAQASWTRLATDDCEGGSAGQRLMPTRDGFYLHVWKRCLSIQPWPSVGGLWISSLLKQNKSLDSYQTLFLQKCYPCSIEDHQHKEGKSKRLPPHIATRKKSHFIQEDVELRKSVSST